MPTIVKENDISNGMWWKSVVEELTGHQLIPGAQCFRLEELGRVVGCEGLVDFECGDARRDYVQSDQPQFSCVSPLDARTVWSPPGDIATNFVCAR